MNTKLLTAPELAEALGFKLRTIKRLARTRVIPVVRLGHRTLRYDKEHVEAALLRREVRETARRR